jgi:hypothetical protein
LRDKKVWLSIASILIAQGFNASTLLNLEQSVTRYYSFFAEKYADIMNELAPVERPGGERF